MQCWSMNIRAGAALLVLGATILPPSAEHQGGSAPGGEFALGIELVHAD